MNDSADLAALPAIPRDAEGPVFREPWEAQAFALVVQLHRRGVFAWKEWTALLGAEIADASKRGEADRGQDYYRYWLSALEKMLAKKNLTDAAALQARREATRANWPSGHDHVARRTPLVIG